MPVLPSDLHRQLVSALATLEGARHRNQAAQATLATAAHNRAAAANLERAQVATVLDGGDAELPAVDYAHALTDEENRLRRVGVLLDGSALDPDEIGDDD